VVASVVVISKRSFSSNTMHAVIAGKNSCTHTDDDHNENWQPASSMLRVIRMGSIGPYLASSPRRRTTRASCCTRACPLRIPTHTRASSQHTQSYANKFHPVHPSHLPLTDVYGWRTIAVVATLPLLPLVGPCVCRHRRRHSSRVLHEPARPRQGQISSVDAWTRGWHWTQHLACPARHTRFRGLAWPLPRPQSQHRRQREQLGALLSLVRPTFFFWHAFRSHPFVAFC